MAAERVAVLGGGIGGLTAAYQLARQRDEQGQPKFDVTVYQMGWRLGGKLATGRNLDAAKGKRIEEHGIHGFMGSYYNAGEMMSEIYQDLASIPGLEGFYTTFDDAFVKQNSSVMWEHRDDEWVPWPMTMKPNAVDFGDLSAVRAYRKGLIEILRLLGVHVGGDHEGPGEKLMRFLHVLRGHVEHPAISLGKRVEDFLIDELIEHLEKDDPELEHLGEKIVELTTMVWHFVRPLLEETRLTQLDTGLRRGVIVADFACALLSGFFEDEIPKYGFAHIDGEDYSAWLRRHGAAESTLRSPFALNTPDITYNFPGGDMTRGPSMSAGAFVQWTLQLFGYVGAFVLAFRAGSGETVLAPVYRALKHYGVRFEFFHKVTGLRLSDDKSHVAAVDFDVQATLVSQTAGGPRVEYDPLVGPVKGLMCWPDRPRYEQLVEGQQLEEQDIDLESYWTPWEPVARTSIAAGSDFDRLVLGISLGGLPFVCPELLADVDNGPLVADPKSRSRWQLMVDEIETVQTQAMQLWFKEPVKGYLDPTVHLPDDDEWIAGTYVLPIAGQAEFSKLLSVEDWPEDGPKGLLYLCGPMADSGIPDFDDAAFPAMQRERVRAQCVQYLQAVASPMLPGASTETRPRPTTPGSLDFDLLYVGGVDGDDLLGEQRFEFQFWRANIDPTERYVTCQPGCAQYRLKAWESGYENLTLTGDWIDTGLNVGSVEGAVMGGKLASHAISGVPALDDVYGYDPFGLESERGDRVQR